MSKKIGLLVPKSVLYPTMGLDMVSGLKASLKASGSDAPEIITESVGIAGDAKLIYGQCEKLILAGAKVIAGYLNAPAAEALQPLLAGTNALFINLDPGYHFAQAYNAPDNVFYVSLQGSFCSRVALEKACADGAKKFAMSCSYYDAGYRAPFAFGKAQEDGKLVVTFNHITKLNKSEFTMEPLAEHMAKGETTHIYAAFCGDMAADFYKAIGADARFSNAGIVGSPFMGEEQWLSKMPYAGKHVDVCVPWATSLDNDMNTTFRRTMEEDEANANIFSLLGWELGHVYNELKGAANLGERVAILKECTIASPRGDWRFHADTHISEAPVYHATAMASKDNNYRLEVTGPAEHIEELKAHYTRQTYNIAGPMSSWLNAYPCLES